MVMTWGWFVALDFPDYSWLCNAISTDMSRFHQLKGRKS